MSLDSYMMTFLHLQPHHTYIPHPSSSIPLIQPTQPSPTPITPTVAAVAESTPEVADVSPSNSDDNNQPLLTENVSPLSADTSLSAASSPPSSSTAGDVVPLAENIHPMQTRAKSGIVKPRLVPTLLLAQATPTTAKQALKDIKWKEAMQTEFDALLHKHGPLSLYHLTEDPLAANGYSGLRRILMGLLVGTKHAWWLKDTIKYKVLTTRKPFHLWLSQ